jgi:AraC-like DNA-binding protein
MRMWQTIRTSALKRHVHTEPYVSIVLSGVYEEAGDLGRFSVGAGDVIVHDRFEAHSDRFVSQGAAVLNLHVPPKVELPTGLARVEDLDLVVRVAQRAPQEALIMLVSVVEPYMPPAADWPEELAIELRDNPSLRLREWSEKRGLAPWTVTRGFTQVFAVTPEAFRLRSRARTAWKQIERSREKLVDVAARCGFSDQAHMARSVASLTGLSPRAWRIRANRFKTG